MQLLWYILTGFNVMLHKFLEFHNPLSEEPGGRFLETFSYSRLCGTDLQRCTRNRLAKIQDVYVSERTIRKRLNATGLTARRPACGPELTRERRVKILAFMRAHVHRDLGQWSKILFTGESRFDLQVPDGHPKNWMSSGKDILTTSLFPDYHHSMMVQLWCVEIFL